MTDAPSNSQDALGVEHEFEVWQGDAPGAAGIAPSLEQAVREASRYAVIYGQDGPVTTFVRVAQQRRG